MTCWLKTPLHTSLASNAADVKANERAPAAGETEEIVQPEFVSSAETVLWVLKPTENKERYLGMEPTMLALRDSGPRLLL